jgi:hypothetical protein
VLGGGSGQRHAPASLLPVKNLGTHWRRVLVGTRVGLDVFGDEENFLPRPEFQVIPACSLVAVPTTLSQPQSVLNTA